MEVLLIDTKGGTVLLNLSLCPKTMRIPVLMSPAPHRADCTPAEVRTTILTFYHAGSGVYYQKD